MLISRRKFLSVAASTALATLGFPFLSKSGANRGFGNAEEIERVILMILDGSRYECLHRMPHLRRFTENFGFSFTNAETIMTSNTVATHVSLITGAYPERTGVSGNAIYIREEDFYQFVMHSPRHIQAETMVESVKKQDDGIKIAFVTGKWRVPSNIAFSRDEELIADIVLTGYRSGIPLHLQNTRMWLGFPKYTDSHWAVTLGTLGAFQQPIRSLKGIILTSCC